MSDDENVVHLSDVTKLNRGSQPSDAPDISSSQGAITWVSKYYATLEHEGQFFIINWRVPGKRSFMKRQAFVDSLEIIDFK
jgi:hypothetical protein